ncbi:MAG: DUF1127 domain-containing protein [Alphaproteobacteria bacterium]|nr:DUF1127 domain-containing protein [Alphaproteobacteria bacterium]
MECGVDPWGAWRAAFSAVGVAVSTSVVALAIWQDRARARARLEGLDDSALKDMGLSRADVSREIEKPFWRG